MEINYKEVTIKITTFGVNSSEIEGLDEFKSELESIYTIECNNESCAACGGASELGILITIGNNIFDAATSGTIWDIIKYGLSKCWSSLKKLKENNECLTAYLTFDFGGFNLHVSEAMNQSISSLEDLLQNIENNVLFLDSHGYTDITSITMPFIETNDRTNRFVEKEPYEDSEEYWWKVEYQKGCTILYLNPRTHEVFIYY